MADPLLAQSAVDRLSSTAYELVVTDGRSWPHWWPSARDKRGPPLLRPPPGAKIHGILQIRPRETSCVSIIR
jgi:hypothetical protein